MPNVPISIITICFNAEKIIEDTLKSVVNQTFTDIQYIVIDGGSTDSTLDILGKYKEKIDILISEPDNGIYNAMNKGIKFVEGDYILFLNAGDKIYDSDTLQKVFTCIQKNPTKEFFYGDVEILSGNKRHSIRRFKKKLTKSALSELNICHQSIFYKHSLFQEYGLYDESLKIYADYDYNLKIILAKKVSYKHLGEITSSFSLGGISTQKENYQERLKEKTKVKKKYFNPMFLLLEDFKVRIKALHKKLYR